MTLLELRNALRELLRDTAEPFLWTDDYLQDLLNQATVMFVLTVGRPVVNDSISVSAPASSFPLPAIHLVRASVQGVFDDTTGEFVFDTPITDDTTVDVTYLPEPKPMTVATDTPQHIPRVWHRSLVYWSAYIALYSDDAEGRNDSLGMEMLRRWRADIARYRALQNNHFRRSLVARPDPAYT